MNTSIMNSTYDFENYNFIVAPNQQHSSNQKINYHGEQIYSVQTESEFHHGYNPVVPVVTGIPVVPSQIDIYSTNNNIPSSPESIVSSPYNPIPPSSSTVFLSIHNETLDNDMSLKEKVSQRIPNVNQLPDSLLPEFHQYSREIYENSGSNKRNRRQKQCHEEEFNDEEDCSVHASELRRQVHIQSEQKRRAQIKDGFDTLRQHLPSCVNKKLSKAALLKRTVQHLQHLKKSQASILVKLEKLVQENERLKLEQQRNNTSCIS